MIRRGEIWWADLGKPRGSAPAYNRPVLILSSDTYNRSKIKTVIAAVITSNTKLAAMPGNVLLQPAASGLPKPSVVNVSQILTVDRLFVTKRVHRLANASMRLVDNGLRGALELP